MILFKNCSVLPELMDGFSEAKCDILTDGKRIKGIYKCGECPFESETVIDEDGRFVLPGFIDMHVHLTLSGDDTRIDNEKSGVQRGYDALKYAQDALNAGFTVLRDVGATHNIAINLRNSINKGDFVGPTIYACGLILTPTEIGNDFLPGLYSEVDTPDEIIKAVRQEVAKGADYIKVMGSGSAQNPGGEPGKPIITLEDLKVMVEAAAFKDTYVAAHCHGATAIHNAILAGVHTIEHASYLTDESIELLKGNTDSYIIPTLLIVWKLTADVAESSAYMGEKAREMLNAVKTGIRKAYDAGLTLGFGTDTGIDPVHHGQNSEEFALRRDFWGMKEIDILKQATINSAKIMGIDKDYGTLAVGKYADFVVLDRNPLKDIAAAHDGVVSVVKWGKVVR